MKNITVVIDGTTRVLSLLEANEMLVSMVTIAETFGEGSIQHTYAVDAQCALIAELSRIDATKEDKSPLLERYTEACGEGLLQGAQGLGSLMGRLGTRMSEIAAEREGRSV